MNRTTPLRRTGPIKKRARKDPVTPEMRQAVLERDQGCVAPMLQFREHPLATFSPCSGLLTLDHVRDEPMMGKRAPSDMRHLVVLCRYHHLESGWATSHRPELRAYLEAVNAAQ